MLYLKPLISKILSDEPNKDKIINETYQLKSDKEILEHILQFVNISEVETAFNHHYGIEYKHLNNVDINEKLLKDFDIDFLKKEGIIPLSYNQEKSLYHFAISNLIDRNFADRIRQMLKSKKQNVVFYFAFEYEILDKLEELEIELEPIITQVNIQSDVESTTDLNVIDWVNNVLNKGIELKASDIHIERLETGLQIRYRVDGLLINKVKYNFNENEVSSIYVRLKIISNMDIVESRRSQDGRIDNYTHNNELYDLRVSTVNTIHGEKFVLRLLKKNAIEVPFSELGFTKENEKKVKNMLSKQNGIIYLAGATGSGKTTTLYTMIDEIKDDSINIYTIENPVEKTIKGINQIQIDEAAGTDYPTILRALLRQDPNVIVVGEIRDSETAELSIRASLTGHLVLSTIHSNSALDSLSRLEDMGVESYLVGASSIGVLSQRLIRKLCPVCKVKRENLELHEELWIKDEIINFDYEKEKNRNNFIYKAKGCNQCSNGYKGRIAIVEVLTIDDNLRSLISRKATAAEIKKYVMRQGYKTLKFDGIIKAIRGIISIDELMGQV